MAKYCEGRLVQSTTPHENKKDWLLVKLKGFANLRILTQAQYDALPTQPHNDDTAACHYCGMDATGFGFFDEPVCPECGG